MRSRAAASGGARGSSKLQPLDGPAAVVMVRIERRHAQAHQQREQTATASRRCTDDGAVGQPVEIGGLVLDRKVLGPTSHGSGP